MEINDYTQEYEESHLKNGLIHVVLLGAGASYAAFPNGDKNGRRLPLLRDFVDVIGLKDLVEEAGCSAPFDDFEGIYSKIASDPQLSSIRDRIDAEVTGYFESLELPDNPTLYDHLVLSLRQKDVIATFNWDPFLWQACQRNYKFAKPPSLLFLHGSVAISQCPTCKCVRDRGKKCPSCNGELIKVPILFPVTKKDYNTDPAIAAHWRTLKKVLQKAYIFTIFGYSAPKTDIEAVGLLKAGWGEAEKRKFEQTEIVDIKDEDSIRSTWDDFIHTHHYEVKRNFYESLIGCHPRRSCEALWSQLMDCRFIKRFPICKDADFPILYKWLSSRIKKETSAQ